MEKKKYPIGAEYYTLYEEVGEGVSATVHRALCITHNEIVAIKIIDFERKNSDLVIPLLSITCLSIRAYNYIYVYIYMLLFIFIFFFVDYMSRILLN